MKSVIAENVKSIIRREKLKQGAVAERAGYDYKAFNNMLNGRKIITDVDVMNIANALAVKPNELYGLDMPAKEEVGWGVIRRIKIRTRGAKNPT